MAGKKAGTSKRAAERAARGLPEPPLCRAHNHDGSPCGKNPIAGAVVCRMHGGGAPAVKEAARNRLAMAGDILMAALLKIAASAESEAVRLAAVKDALDRAGFSATNLVKIAVTQPWEDMIGEIVMDGEIFEDIPAGTAVVRRHNSPAFRDGGLSDPDGVSDIPFPNDDDDTAEFYNRTTMQHIDNDDHGKPWSSNNYRPQTIRGEVIYSAGTPEQQAQAARSAQRGRAALFAQDGQHADTDAQRSEYSEQGNSDASSDPNRPPQYVREAMEDAGEDWRPAATGRRAGGSARADISL